MTTLVHDSDYELLPNEYANLATEYELDHESTHEIWIESSGFES